MSGPMGWLSGYANWLHLQWPAGRVEPLPVCDSQGRTNVAGLYLAGDLTGVPLLKFALDSGARAVATALQERGRANAADANVMDVIVLGAGPAGLAAAMEAQRLGLRFLLFEGARPLATLADFPPQKPIYTYPAELVPAGGLQLHAASSVKEGLLEDLQTQIAAAGMTAQAAMAERVEVQSECLAVHGVGSLLGRARSVIVAIGRTGDFRKLNVPGEEGPNVFRRLHDPAQFSGQAVVVVGAGDTALETASALAEAGARVTLLVRGDALQRPKPENVERWQKASSGASSETRFNATVEQISPTHVQTNQGQVNATAVFLMVGRQAPLPFFRRSGVRIAGERNSSWWLGLTAFLVFALWLYHWKASYAIPFGWQMPSALNLQPANLLGWLGLTSLGLPPTNPIAILVERAKQPGFWYTLVYSCIIVGFGIARMRRRKTRYVRWQTLTLMAVQVGPLFLLPELLLPWLDANGFFAGSEVGRWLEATFFPGKSWWRAYGFVLAWPLMVWNWFTAEPLWGWLVVGVLQTFVLVPLLVYRFGKGAYCGWICSCGALAETLGDQHRHKMPHGPEANRWNMVGQVVLLWVTLLMGLRVAGWVMGPASWPAQWASYLHTQVGGGMLSYNWLVDLLVAGVIGYGVYFWFSGRVWCRFACPLAALMHIYARFSRFAIVAEKSKCISCNVCTSVCHQGIDVMSFAVRGKAMQDPECVRCSACVQGCPTGVLAFGTVDGNGKTTGLDSPRFSARLVQIQIPAANGKG